MSPDQEYAASQQSTARWNKHKQNYQRYHKQSTDRNWGSPSLRPREDCHKYVQARMYEVQRPPMQVCTHSGAVVTGTAEP